MNRPVKAALSAVRDFLSGRSGEPKNVDADDEDLRQAVAAELMASIGGVHEPIEEGNDEQAPSEAQAIADDEKAQMIEQQERSKQLFMESGYFDEAVQDLRAGKSAADRAAAARALGLAGGKRATAHLIAAMFDDDAAVRSAAGEALNQIGDPSVSGAPVTEVLVPASEAPDISAQDADTSPIPTDEIGANTSAGADAFAETPPTPDSPAEIEDAEETLGEQATQPPVVNGSETVTEDEQLLLEEHAVRETIEQYERQLVESAALRQKAENEAQWRADRIAEMRAGAQTRRVEYEVEQKRAEEEAARRRKAEARALASEQSARQKAEAEVSRIAEEEARLWLETNKLRQAAEELARQRRQIETARRQAAEAARHAEATRAREEAEKLHLIEVQRLENEEQALRFALEEKVKKSSELEASRRSTEAEIASVKEERSQLIAAAETQVQRLNRELEQLLSAEAARRTDAERRRNEAEERQRTEEEQLQQQLGALNKVNQEVAARRAEVESARAKAEREARQLQETLSRMRAAEEERARTERERLQVEAATRERVETEHRLLEEARRRAEEEQARLEEEKRRHSEAEKQRIVELEELQTKRESEAKQLEEREQQILREIDRIRIVDAEVRHRIEEAETRRRASEQAYRLAAEKVQRTEAEAHTAALQEEQTLAKLEALRRDGAAEAQSRAAQEKQIREEIEELRQIHDGERPRLEEAILQRSAAAGRLQEMRENRHAVTPRAEDQFQIAPAFAGNAGEQAESIEVQPPTASLAQEDSSAIGEDAQAAMDHELPQLAGATLQPAVDLYLKSVDPYKRAAAVAELARSEGKEGFTLIADCFDDPSPHVRNAAARALSQLEPARSVDFFNRALEEGSEERRRSIGSSIAGSGLANEAIEKLMGDNREETYNALSILFIMAKTGEVQPLVRAIEEHPNDEISRAVVKLLALSGQAQSAEAAMKKRRGEG